MRRKRVEEPVAPEVPGGVSLNLELFPEVPKAVRPRLLYFSRLTLLDAELLKQRGYEPVLLLHLPRSSDVEEIAYLMAKVQGIEEGTIFASDAEVHALELEMKAYNLLAQKHIVMRFDNREKQKGKSLDEVMSTWTKSRHTLRGNSTIASMQLPTVRRPDIPTGEGKMGRGETSRSKRKKYGGTTS